MLWLLQDPFLLLLRLLWLLLPLLLLCYCTCCFALRLHHPLKACSPSYKEHGREAEEHPRLDSECYCMVWAKEVRCAQLRTVRACAWHRSNILEPCFSIRPFTNPKPTTSCCRHGLRHPPKPISMTDRFSRTGGAISSYQIRHCMKSPGLLDDRNSERMAMFALHLVEHSSALKHSTE